MKFINYLQATPLVLLILISQPCQGQEVVDSIATAYRWASYEQGDKFLRAGEYVRALFFNDRQQESMDILKENIRLARNKKDGKYAAYLYGMGSLNYRILNDSIQSILFIDSAKVFANLTADRDIKGYVKYCEGWLYARENREVEAVKAFVEGLQFLENTQNATRYKIPIYKELYAIYTNWSAYDLQKKYATLTLELATKDGNTSRLFDAYMLMGGMYEHQYRTKPTDISLRDSAEYFYLAAVETYQSNSEKMVIPSDLAHAANNLANLYLEFQPDSFRNEVEKYALLSIDISTRTEQHSFLASSYGILSELAWKDGDLQGSKNYLLAALASIMKENLPSTEIVSLIFLKLSQIFETEENYAEALHYYKQYQTSYEEMYDAEKMKLSRRLEAQYEKEKYSQEVARLQLETEKKEQQIRLMAALSVQQQQQLENMKLIEENQRQQFAVMRLTAEKNKQELTLAKIQTQQKAEQLESAQREVAFKSRTNRLYVILFFAALVSLALLFYAYAQRSKSMKQQSHLHHLEIEKVKQQNEITNLNAMLDGQEQERTRLARDLHDGLGGLLSGTKIELSGVSSKIQDQFVMQKVNKSLTQLDNAVNELRRVAHNLMPELLLKYGMVEAIKEYCNRMSSDTLDVSAEIVGYDNSLETNRQVLVYRIIQELVNNAVKHAEAKQIFIQLAQTDNTIFLTVEDDGDGFDVASLDGRKSAGMHNVHSRLDFLKGKLHIDSRQGMGTTVEIEFPLTNEN